MLSIMQRCTIGLLIWGSLVNLGVAEDFRIVSEVFVGDSSTPVSHNLTLFSDRLICDLLLSDELIPQPKEVTLFDSQRKRFILLDMQRKVRTEISDLQLNKLVETLAYETQLNEKSKFLISDLFTDEVDWNEGTVRLSGPNIAYQFKGSQPKDVLVLSYYFEFLDNFTKLNATDPRKIPPFPRMQLNQKIKQLGWLPSEVRVNLKANEFFREEVDACSKHVLTMGLTSRDKELLANAKRDWLQFKLVELTEYRQLGGNTPAGATKTSPNIELGRRN
jgi:hypothetical protein